MCLHQGLASQTQQPAEAVGRHAHHSVTVTVTIAIAIATLAGSVPIGLFLGWGAGAAGCDGAGGSGLTVGEDCRSVAFARSMTSPSISAA